MNFCALTVDQHKSLYKLVYKNILDSKAFALKDFSQTLYDKVLGATQNHDLALTYVSYVPAYVSSMQSEDKEIRDITKAAKVDANELLDKIDEWENNLPNVESYLGVAEKPGIPLPKAQQQFFENLGKEEPTPTVQEVQRVVAEGVRTARSKAEIESIMKDIFGLGDAQAAAVAAIYDRVAQSYAARNNTTPIAFYDQLGFRQSQYKDVLGGNTLFSTSQMEKIDKEKEEVRKATATNGKFMKAPNGKKTNLPEGLWLTTQTPTFKAWFGNSKAIDENGEPQVFFHGSPAAFDVFNPERGGRNAIFLTPEFDFAQDYTTHGGISTSNLYELFAKTDKPFDYENKADMEILKEKLPTAHTQLTGGFDEHGFATLTDENNWAILERPDFQTFLKDNGYDGFYVKEQGIKNLAVYQPNQVKSISGNKTFESENPSIFFQGTESNAFDRVITGFKLESAEGFSNAFTTKNGKATPQLAKRINDWLRENQIPGVRFVYESTYGTVNAIPTAFAQKQDLIAHAAVQIAEDGQAIIHALTDPNVSSPLHELAHVWERQLSDAERKAVLDWTGQFDETKTLTYEENINRRILEGSDGKEIIDFEVRDIDGNIITRKDTIDKAKGVVDKYNSQSQWNTATSEAFARGFEKYLSEGYSPNVTMSDLFLRFKQWLTDIYKGIFGSEIDIELNDKMRTVYANMLGTNFRESTMAELRGEEQARTTAQKLAEKFAEEANQSKDFTTPIPPGSINYWSHLSTIQQAFIQKKYDQLVTEGKITEDQLRDIINSTVSHENAGLSMDLVDQTMFRVNNPQLIEDKNYWVTFPNPEGQEFDSYKRTVKEIISNGSLLDAIKNDIVTPDVAKRILTHSGQIGIKEEAAIKQKQKEQGITEKQVKEITIKATKQEIPAPESTNKEVVMKTLRDTAKGINQKATAKGAEAGTIGNIYAAGLANTKTEAEFDQAMHEIAQQANNPEIYDAMVKSLGLEIVSRAQEMFPEAKVEGFISLEERELNEGLSKAELEATPVIPDESPVSIGDVVSVKGQELTVEDITYGETPEDNMYFLNDGSAKFASQVQRVRTGNDQMVEEFNKTAPEVFRQLEDEDNVKGELTEDDKSEAFTYLGLKTVLDRLNNKFNNVVKYKILSTDENWKGRFKNGFVEINLKRVDKTTPFHEYLHPFIEVLKKDNYELYGNLAAELASSEEGRAIIEEVKNSEFYKNGTKDEIGDEALVRYISKKASENVTKEGRRIETKYKSALSRLVDKFRDWFNSLWVKGKTMILSDLSTIPLTTSLQDIADMVSLHDMQIDLSERLALIQSIEKYQTDAAEETTTFEAGLIKTIKSKLNVLEDTAKNRIGSPELLREVIAIRHFLKDPDEATSLSNYMQQGFLALDHANRSFKEVTNKLFAAKGNLTHEDLTGISKDLDVIKNLITFYKEANTYFQSGKEDISQEEYLTFRKILDKNEKILENLNKTQADITTEWLYPYVARLNEKIKDKYPEYVLSKEKFAKSLLYADNDVDQAFFLLGSIGSSKDTFSAVTRAALYSLVEENHLYEAELLEDTKSLYNKFLSSAGLTNTRKDTIDYYKNNYLRKATMRYVKGHDEEHNPIWDWAEHWAFKQKYNYDLFDKARIDFQESIGFDDKNAEHIKQLIAWEAANATSIQVGTKKELRTQYEDPRNPRSKKISEEWVDVPIMELRPNDNYLNLDYAGVENDPFYKHLLDNYNIANEKLGENRLQYGIVPQVSKGKNAFVEYKDKTALQKIKLVGGKAYSFFVAPTIEEETNAKILENLDGSKNYTIKGYYNMLLQDSDLDLALPETLVKFAGNANLNSLKAELNPLVKVAKSLIEDNPKLKQEARKITQVTTGTDPKTGKQKTIFDKIFKRPASVEKARTRLNEQLVEFINDAMYGESSIQTTINVFGRAIDVNKLGRNWAFLTALNNMALNINGAVNNWMIGKAQAFIEATGGRYFTKGDYAKAEGQYNLNISNFMKDGFNLKKSLITQMGIKYDAIQGEFRDKYGKRFVGNVAERYANSDTIFILNHIAEHEIQLKGFLAYMNAVKVKTNTGETISLYDAHYLNADGNLRVRDDIAWSQQDSLDFINTWHGINKRLNGNYSSFDKTTMQRRWYGQLALVYRKYIYTSIRNRFTKQYVDYELGNVDFGYQRKFFNKLASDVKEYKFEAAKRFFTREGWNQDEKQAYNKTLTEFGFLAGAFTLALAIGMGESDDKETSWAKKALQLYIVRFQQDMQIFTVFGVSNIVKILTNPSAVMLTMTKYADFFNQLATGPTDTYTKKTGMFEAGELKLKGKLFKALPIVRQVVNFATPQDQLAYYNVLQK